MAYLEDINDKKGFKGFPSDFVSPEEKEKDAYGLSMFEAIYGRHIRIGDFDETVELYRENRRYAEGLQDIDQYKDRMDVNGDTSYMNLDWSAVPMIPMYVDILVGEMINKDYKIICDAIDKLSRIEKDKKRDEIRAKMKAKEFSDEMKEITGIPVVPDDEDMPGNEEELDVWMQLNYKPAVEIAMEEIIDFIYTNSDWNQIKQKVYRDLVVLKKGALKIYYDENDAIKLRYVDPVNLVTSYTDKQDYSTIKYAGEILKLPIRDVRAMSKGKLSEADLFDIAKQNADQHDNRTWDFGDSYEGYYQNYGIDGQYGRGYDDFLVPVFDGQFYSITVKSYEQKFNDDGWFYYNEKPFGYESPEGTNNKKSVVDTQDLEVVYSGAWVVGTKYMLDYGLERYMPREHKDGIYSPNTTMGYQIFSPDIYDMQNKSLVERMRPHADQIQLAHLKIQHLMSKIAPPGLMVDVSALKDVFLGKGKEGAGPLELQELAAQTGVWYVNGENEEGMPMNRKPIEVLNTSVGMQLNEIIGVYNHHREMLQIVTGISPGRDAVSVDKNLPVQQQQNMLKSSRNATMSLETGLINLYERSAKRCSLMIQDCIEYKTDGLTGMENAISEQALETVREGDRISMAEMGIKIQAKPDDEQRAIFERDLQISLETGALRMEDAITLRGISNTKLANQYLIAKRKQFAKETAEEAMANAKANSQQQQESTMVAAQAEVAKAKELAAIELQQEGQLSMIRQNETEKEYILKMELERVKGEEKLKQVEEQKEGDVRVKVLENAMNKSTTE